MSDRAGRFDRADYATRARADEFPSGKLDRILEALTRSVDYLGPAARAKLDQIWDRDTALCLAFLLALWGGLQFTPAGPVADLVIAAAGLYSFVSDFAEIVKGAAQAADAESDEELDKAAQAMAKGLSDTAIDALIALVGGAVFAKLRGLIRAVRGRLLGRRFAGGSEKPLRLGGKVTGFVETATYLAQKKKSFEQAADDWAWIAALTGGVLLVGGVIVYIGERGGNP